MSRKRFMAEQIIGLLQEPDVKLSQGRNVGQVSLDICITEHTYYHRHRKHGSIENHKMAEL